MWFTFSAVNGPSGIQLAWPTGRPTRLGTVSGYGIRTCRRDNVLVNEYNPGEGDSGPIMGGRQSQFQLPGTRVSTKCGVHSGRHGGPAWAPTDLDTGLTIMAIRYAQATPLTFDGVWV